MKYLLSRIAARVSRRTFASVFIFAAVLASVRPAHGEAMLQLFNVSWADMTAKMPEIAEAGYDSLWVPNPAKGESGGYSVGYDLFDPFDLGDKNQKGTTATLYGTKAQLLQMVQTAHRFGIRVYFDNVMNHRAFSIPGNSGTPTNYYPGLIPQDFHLQQTGANTYANWPSISDWNNQWQIQNQSLAGLIDLANEPGSVNDNFGASLGSSITKPIFVRQTNNPEYYMDTTQPAIEGSPWHPFNGTNGVPVAEDVNSYLIRAVIWELSQTACDGFRLDAVKHVPSGFFGDSTATFNGYCGAIQAMFDYVHGYGTNVLGNGYYETNDDSRNSCFDTEAPRNDALIFGEHLGEPPSYSEYISAGMRLLNAPLRDQMNGALGGSGSLVGMEQRDYLPYNGAAFSAAQSVMFAQSQDASGCCATHRDLQNAYYFMHEGVPEIYSDGWNQSGAPNYFPTPPYANYLGESGDNQMPDICYLHNQLARGGTRARWSDNNLVAFERYDYREGSSTNPQDQTVVLFAMNDNYTYPGDATFDDGVGQTYDNYYGGIAISNSKNQGLVVGFPPGSVLVQLCSSATGGNVRAYSKLLVHGATTSLSAAQASVNATDPTQRLIYVGSQTLAPGGGAIELNVPSGSWVMYGYQWPEASRANPATNAIIFKQSGVEVPHITVTRTDGVNGDTAFNPLYPFKMRGSVDQFGNVIVGNNISNRTYAIDVPIVTNANFDILVRSDASCVNTLVKMDGGMDLNSQMGLGPLTGGVGPNGSDLRDNKPGYATDVFLGYEQTAFQFRNGPEKFAARVIFSNNLVSLGAETYYYTVGGASSVVAGAGYMQSVTNQTATWLYHDPAATNTAIAPNNSATQLMPVNPAAGQSADVYVKIGYQSQVNTAYIYYTTDGTNPEGAFGLGKGTTQVAPAFWVNHDSVDNTIDWWKGTIPAQVNGTQVRYKVAAFNGGSYGFSVNNPTNWPSISTISDAEISGSKLYGMTQAAITNFNPTTAVVWLANDLNTNNTKIGLQSGFHIVRARTFLPRTNQSSVYNTFLQTFYYDGALPTGIIAYPTNSSMLTQRTYTVVIRADSTVTGVDCNVQDSDTNNDDIVTGKSVGNGTNSSGGLVFAPATAATPDATLTAQYPNYPQEFRFVYTNVPSSGSNATITVRLKEFGTSVYTNRITTLTASVVTLAPPKVVQIASPATNGTVLAYSTNMIYLVQACFDSSLSPHGTNFNVLVNGVLQPQASYLFQAVQSGSASYCPGYRIIQFYWSNPPLGTNVVQVIYTNYPVPISDARAITVASAPRISGLANNNQLVVWDSAPGVNYQVLATTNLALPFTPVSGIIPGSGTSTYFYDQNPTPQKFYEILMVQ